jgi:ABC-type transport system involved in multi-copper enzyme maturation permease subunit
LFFLAQLWSKLSFTNYFNIFNYYQPQKIMLGQGSTSRDILVLFLLTLVCLGLSLRHFGKRDVP